MLQCQWRGDVLTDITIKPQYRSDRDNLLRDFYIPCLAEVVLYRRAVGYFTSDSLSAAAQGLTALIKRRGRLQLVASPILDADDARAIQEGYRRREEILETALVRALERGPLPEQTVERLGFLAWLISEGLLDIRLALVDTNSGLGIYHEKIGIFSDADTNIIAFTGSANESLGGLVSNFESIDVFRSWIPADHERIDPKVQDFEALWDNRTPGLRVFTFPEAAKRALLRFRPTHPPEREPEVGSIVVPGFTERDGPVIPRDLVIRDYQKQAVEAWFRASCRGIWKMATGTGKTIAALAAAVQLYRQLQRSSRPLAVIIVCPYKHLVAQWAKEAQRFQFSPLKCFESRERWFQPLLDGLSSLAFGNQPYFAAITTCATFQSAAFQEALTSVRVPLLLVGDEVHNMGADTIRAVLPDAAPYRLGLSATPERWYDEAGTEALFSYFGPVMYEITLGDAIRMKALTEYYYWPIPVELTEEESLRYVELTKRLAALVGDGDKELVTANADARVKKLLIDRARIVASAQNKLAALEARMRPLKSSTHNLVYCGDGEVEYAPANEAVRQLDAVAHMLGVGLGMKVNSYTAETLLDDRRDLQESFAAGELQALVAIRCLDEGIDIPQTRRAFILASSTNPKQFIQRRGRILRRAPGKADAEIFDFLVVPPGDLLDEGTFKVERRLFRKELERVALFASLAKNGPQAMNTLLPQRQRYALLDIDY